MKFKAFQLFLISILLCNPSYSQSCDCDIIPLSKECINICGISLLQNGTKTQLQQKLKLDNETVQKIIISPNRKKVKSIADFEKTLPRKNYLELKDKYEYYVNSNFSQQTNVNGDNVGHDKIINNNFINSDTVKAKNKLVFHTVGIENTKFLYNTEPWNFTVDPHGEDIMNNLNSYDLRYGLVTTFPFKSSYPRIPSGYMYINFTVENHGNTLLVLDQIELELVADYQIPDSAKINFYKPILKPEQDIVYIKPNKSKYSVFKSKVFKYSPGDADLFRVKVELAKEMPTKIYEYKINLYYRKENETNILTSDRSFFIASVIEPTKEQNLMLQNELFNSDDVKNNIPSFYSINEKIEGDSLLIAKGLLDLRILQLKKLSNFRLKLVYDSGPGLFDCIFSRIILNTYLNEEDAVLNDIDYLSNVYSAELIRRKIDLEKVHYKSKAMVIEKPQEALLLLKRLMAGQKGEKNVMKIFSQMYDMEINITDK